MLVDFDAISPKDAYKLLVSTVVPRPIAWVVTRNLDGVVNTAPFSFFNAFSGNPPTVCIGVGHRAGRGKDTVINVEQTGEFVVNLVSEDLADRMNITAIDFPYGIDEMAEAGLTKVPSQKVSPPRIGESPVALECVTQQIVKLGTDNSLIVGQVVEMFIRDDMMLDPAKFYVDTPKLRLIGRMHGAGMYVRASDLFEMPRLTLASREER
jgi:flavin reductase (DIM6/NTAB) family NADH-FMN oxidoreductase RutF